MSGRIMASLLCCALGAGCVAPSGTADDGEFDLPPFEGGKADDSAITLRWEETPEGGLRVEHHGEFTARNASDALTFYFELPADRELRLQGRVRLSAGEPHLFLRRDAIETLTATHGDDAFETVIPASDEDDRATFQLALFVPGGKSGTYDLELTTSLSCVEDALERGEGGENDVPAQARLLEGPGLYTGNACNGPDGSRDDDFYRIELAEGERLRVTMWHKPAWGPLSLSGSGPLGDVRARTLAEDGLQQLVASEPGSYVLGVGGPGLWNAYQLSVCVDDSLEGDRPADDNDDAERAMPIVPGRHQALRFCNFTLLEPNGELIPRSVHERSDSDWYEVDVSAPSVLRVQVRARDDRRSSPRLGSPDVSFRWIGEDMYEAMVTEDGPVRFRVIPEGYSMASDTDDAGKSTGGYPAYDLTVETLL